ncbi:MAG: AbrB family transcriptional regulator [Spirochaetae bacterium HGW-Spirochaetae-1]|jgi:antitoxin component of MazEF toxin-antitoxin module|nr:MAG: AbrB family transcriptional regulator [Spirochaetae bacterium HGW-Spirochaetae-1]
MIKKIIQHGNSSAVIIDKPVMELLDIDSDSLLEMSTDGSSIILSPVKDRERLNRLKASLDKINSKHSATLKKLAK